MFDNKIESSVNDDLSKENSPNIKAEFSNTEEFSDTENSSSSEYSDAKEYSDDDEYFDAIYDSDCESDYDPSRRWFPSKSTFQENYKWWKCPDSHYSNNVLMYTKSLGAISNRLDIINETGYENYLVNLNKYVITNSSQNHMGKHNNLPPHPGWLTYRDIPMYVKERMLQMPCYEFRRPYIEFIARPKQAHIILKKLENSTNIAIGVYDNGKYYTNKIYDTDNDNVTGYHFINGDYIITTKINLNLFEDADVNPLALVGCYHTFWSSQFLPEGFTPSPLSDPTEYLFSTILNILETS